MQEGEEQPRVREKNCIGCGGCFSLCPVHGAIDISVMDSLKKVFPSNNGIRNTQSISKTLSLILMMRNISVI
jgi:Fe-S-cluster-containing hydrogenase component 2